MRRSVRYWTRECIRAISRARAQRQRGFSTASTIKLSEVGALALRLYRARQAVERLAAESKWQELSD